MPDGFGAAQVRGSTAGLALLARPLEMPEFSPGRRRRTSPISDDDRHAHDRRDRSLDRRHRRAVLGGARRAAGSACHPPRHRSGNACRGKPAAQAIWGSGGVSGSELSRSAARSGRGRRFAGASPRPRSGDQDGAVQGHPRRVVAGRGAVEPRRRGDRGWATEHSGVRSDGRTNGRTGISDAEARGHFAAWAEEDRYFPLDAELGALREAGFAEVECFWRRGLSAVTCALRAS